MPDRKAATLLEDLPGEMMHQIFIRLPCKAVGRCRAVNKSWCSATSKLEFMLEHHRRQPLLPIVNGEQRPAGYVILGDAGAGTFKQELLPLLPGGKHDFMTIRGSCDGFFIICLGTPSQFFIWNPVTRKVALLPEPPGELNSVIGFYCHSPTGEYRYRVLWVSMSDALPKITLHVLTVGYDKPRHAIVRMPAVSSPSMKQKLLTELDLSSNHSSPVHHRGSLHWFLYGAGDITGDGRDILVFDTEAESFRMMHSPAEPCPNRKLFDMKGALAFWAGSTPSRTSMDVWVMQDYEAEIWAFKYRIDLSTVQASRPKVTKRKKLYLSSSKGKKKTPGDSVVQSFNDMVVLNERELLIRFNDKHVLRCDIDGKFLGLVNIATGQYCMSLTQHHLQESILPIPPREMQG